MHVSLTLTDEQHTTLERHLYPGDGLEAAALLLCGYRSGEDKYRLVTRQVIPIPYENCSSRTPEKIVWDTESIIPALEKANHSKLSVIKVHSHPSGYAQFSPVDDYGDKRLISAIQCWIEYDIPHGSAVMLPDGSMFGRFLSSDDEFIPFDRIFVIGDNIVSWTINQSNTIPRFASSHIQAFGAGTFALLSQLTIAVVGCSGTGSPIIEQLARLGVGKLLLVDDDLMEERNINRIINSTMEDVKHKRLKANVLGDAIKRMGLGTKVHSISKNLWDPEVVKRVAQCDVIFGCVDTIDARYLLNSIATYYTIPYFDIGVKIVCDPTKLESDNIIEVCGSVHYLKPGYSLMSRKVFDMEKVRAAGLLRTDPAAFERELADGYIQGVQVYKPAVISLNMTLASLGINELLARLHPFREETNDYYDHIELSLSSMDMFKEQYPLKCPIIGMDIGKGDQIPLLEMPELSGRVADE